MVVSIVLNTLQEINISPWSGIFEDDFPFPQVGYANVLEGYTHLYLGKSSDLTNIFQIDWNSRARPWKLVVGKPRLPNLGIHTLRCELLVLGRVCVYHVYNTWNSNELQTTRFWWMEMVKHTPFMYCNYLVHHPTERLPIQSSRWNLVLEGFIFRWTIIQLSWNLMANLFINRSLNRII